MRHTMRLGAVAALVLTMGAGVTMPVEAAKRARSHSSVNRSNANRNSTKRQPATRQA